MAANRVALGALVILSTLLTACVAQTRAPVLCKMENEPRSEQYAPPVMLERGDSRRRVSAPLPDFSGTIMVEECVDETGHLAREPRIVYSSHIPAVDAEALAYARELQFLPARRAGQVVASCCLATLGLLTKVRPPQ